MSDEIYVLTIYNTITGKYEKVCVTKAVYDEYLHGEFNIKYANHRFYKNEIQFSSLIGYNDGKEEWLAKFVDNKNDPAEIIPEQMITTQLYNCMELLTPDEYELIYALYFCGLSEGAYARGKGVTQQAIFKKKTRILKKFKKFFEK